MRSEMISSILNKLNGTSTDIEASAVISTDGFMIDSVLPNTLDKNCMEAMSAAMLSLGNRTTNELARGQLDQVLIKGQEGYILMTQAGNDAVVTVLAKPQAKLGLVFLDVKRAADGIAELL